MRHWTSPRTWTPLLALALGALSLGAVGATSNDPEPTASANRYIGAAKCKTCHNKTETGDQYGVWHAKPHANAFAVLASPAAKEAGAAQGISDPQTDDACLSCHVTGFGEDAAAFQKGFDRELGIQCESCHGPGEQHLLARFKAARNKVEGYPEIPAGEIISDTPTSVCLACHNEKSPTYKPFCPHERRAEIRHLNPLKPRTAEQLAALEACTCAAVCICKAETDGVCRDAAK